MRLHPHETIMLYVTAMSIMFVATLGALAALVVVVVM
jgi:hypothetical protein